MATTKKSSARSGTSTKSRRPGAGSLERLNESLDAAQKALSDLQDDLGRGARDVVKNVSRLIRDARKDTAKLNRAVMKDIGQLGQALTPGANNSRGNRKAPAKRAATKKSGAKATAGKS